MRRRAIRVTGLTLAGLVTLSGCPEKKKPRPEGVDTPAAEVRPTFEAGGDQAAFGDTWIATIARDPAPLVALAGTSDGWRSFFTGAPREALVAFDADVDRVPEARIGAARAAIELAEAHARLALLVRALTPQMLKAQASRPGADASAAWRSYIDGRLAQARGQDPAAAFAAVPADSPAAAFVAAATAPSEAAAADGAAAGDAPAADQAAVAALLRGDAAGSDATLPAGGTDAYAERLQIRALVAAGRIKEASKRLERLDPAEPDIVIGEGTGRLTLRDPIAADVHARLHAARVVELLADDKGWPRLLKADALRMLDRDAEALAELDALLAAPPAEAPFAMLVVSDALGVDDLKSQAHALRARLLAEKGDAAGAVAVVDAMPVTTVGQRVWKSWAGSFAGKGDPAAFPEDRTVVARLYIEAIEALGEAAKGVNDVTELALVDRYVDTLQRRHADALVRLDQPARAVKMREAAEEKTSAQAPSARNALSALTAAALDSVAIGRPRVALKYLSRMSEALPAAKGPDQMLRDLLSHRALEHSGDVTVGQ